MRELFIIAAIVVGSIGYNVWLNWGCETVGMMTWHGKVCLSTE